MSDLIWQGRAIGAQVGVELRLTLRRGESVLITLIVPVVLLVFFSSLGIARAPGAGGPPVDYLLPGLIALAVISTGMVSAGIATAYERYYGVLKLLGGSPLPRAGLVIAKALAVLTLEAVQVGLLVAVATLAYGWRPHGNLPVVLLILILGTAAFTGLGLAMAGALRAEMTLAAANGLYLLFLMLGDVILPLDHLPGPLQVAARVSPAAPFAGALRAAMGGVATDVYAGSLLEVGIWAAVFVGLATFKFRWE